MRFDHMPLQVLVHLGLAPLQVLQVLHPFEVPCKLAVCGDGITDHPVEECDDGNSLGGDGCVACRREWVGGGGGYTGTTGGTGGL